MRAAPRPTRKGEIIPRPIKSRIREASRFEFFISTHGGQKGLADTALRNRFDSFITASSLWLDASARRQYPVRRIAARQSGLTPPTRRAEPTARSRRTTTPRPWSTRARSPNAARCRSSRPWVPTWGRRHRRSSKRRCRGRSSVPVLSPATATLVARARSVDAAAWRRKLVDIGERPSASSRPSRSASPAPG